MHGKASRSSRINVNMKRHFRNENPGTTSEDADVPAAAPDQDADGQHDEPMDDERSQFTRRLESFGLGEGQSPLLTDCVWSLDADGNLR
jgi:hypothetical protein